MLKNSKFEFLIPIVLLLLFVLITLPGIDWGLPGQWHPDEVAKRVINAIHGEWEFDSINFEFPSLPKHIMFFVGKISLAISPDASPLWSMRLISVFLGGGVVALTYLISRRLGLNILLSTAVSLVVATNGQLAQNASFAHNDSYLTFFVTLSTFVVLQYVKSRKRGWLYLSAFVIGLTASSKYNGGAVIIVPVVLFLLFNRKTLIKKFPCHLETFILTTFSAIAGYGLGTPKSVLWFTFYIKRLIPALGLLATYEIEPGDVRGIFGQYEVIADLISPYWLILVLISAGWLVYQLIRKFKSGARNLNWWDWLTLFLILIAFDMPIMISYNYPSRFFLPMIPIFAVITGIGLSELQKFLKNQYSKNLHQYIPLLVLPILIVGSLRCASVSLLMQNDSREAATEFVNTLESTTKSIEFTSYPPIINRDNWERAHHYPLVFLKYPDQEIPQSPYFEYNAGLEPLNKRGTDYLVIDSFTYERFNSPEVCSIHQVECDFFEDLLAGKTNYQEIASFEYTLPEWFPDYSPSFINPEIKVFERIDQ